MAQSAGAISRAVARMIAKRATVVATERLADGFVEIALEAPGFRGVAWTPGCKVQVAMGSMFETRTYTPMDWDADRGRIRILGYLHGRGPGSEWLRDARPGDSCDVLGPRHSLDVRTMNGPIAFYGDETSVGLAYASSRHTAPSCSYRFEANDPRTLRQVLNAWGLRDVEVVARSADEGNLSALTGTVPAFAAAGASFILTGKAQTIQRLKMALKNNGISSRRTLSKAYWAPGKVGLD